MKVDSVEERLNPEVNDDFFDYEEELRSPERYRQVNLLAVLSTTVGGLSALTMFHWYLGFIPVAGIILAALAQRQISRAPEEYTGQRLVIAGFALSLGMWLFGAGVLTFSRMREVPIGYELITWQTLKPERSSGEILPKTAIDLHEKRVYLKGYMYPGRQVINLKEFLLVPTQGHCKFCTSQIAKHEIVRVKFVGDYKADYTTHHVGIGGKLLVDQSPGFHESGGLPYTIEADVFQ
ncbi:MAG: DUF4190 domain-containing protein [Pirellulales bacterium]|nr:DUF4190 domain-containing protein [Pirellulales bacterium]